MTSQRPHIRITRYAVQLFFLLLTLYIGHQFYHFVLHFERPGHPFVERPPSVDAFLPIGGLMATKYFLFTGIADPVHPAGFVIFIAVLAVSLLMKKGFCGWICPVGTISQYLWMAGEKLFGRNLRMQAQTDLALRSLKYMLLGIFILLIGIAMTPNMMVLFFITDYYKAVDVRMMKFFTEMSTLTLWVLITLGVLSLLFRNFWCRYLCPYGALLGLLSYLSPLKIRRKEENCSHCHSCSRHCPTLIDVEGREEVNSPECFGCMTCVSRCPSQGALEMKYKVRGRYRVLRPVLYPVLLLAVFYLINGIGMITGTWQSKVPYEEYKRIIPEISSGEKAQYSSSSGPSGSNSPSSGKSSSARPSSSDNS